MNTRKTYLELKPGDRFLAGLSKPMYVFIVLETTIAGDVITSSGVAFNYMGSEIEYKHHQLHILDVTEEGIDAFLKDKEKDRLSRTIRKDIDYSAVPMKLLKEVSSKLERYAWGLNND